MTNYEFVIKHRQAFIVYCQGKGICANPHDAKTTFEFRKAVEKQLKSMRKARPPRSKPRTFALIGSQKDTVKHKGEKGQGVYESFELPAKHRAFVADDSGFLVL